LFSGEVECELMVQNSLHPELRFVLGRRCVACGVVAENGTFRDLGEFLATVVCVIEYLQRASRYLQSWLMKG